MGVHSHQVFTLVGGMHASTTPETLPFEAGDPEWVADLFDTLRAGDLDAVVDQLDELDELLRVLRRAAKARRTLATIDPELVREGLELRAGRAGQS